MATQPKPTREALALTGRKIGEIAAHHEKAYAAATNDFDRSLILSCSMIDLRLAVREFLPVLRELQGSRLGFLTDRDPGKGDKKDPYPDQVIVDCAVEAIVRGARWVGNEFNVLAGGCYLTKAYWARKVAEVPGLTDLELNPEVPELVGAKCVVAFLATWRLDGRPMDLARKFPIIVRNYQTDDATLGKAEAKMLRAIYKRVTGSDISDAGDDEPAALDPPPATAPPALEASAPPATTPTEPARPAAAEAPPTAEEMAEWDRQREEIERDRAASGIPF